MRCVHRAILSIGLALPATLACAQSVTPSPTQCYGSLAPPPPPLSTPSLAAPTPPANSSVPPPTAPEQQNPIGGVTVQPSNPNPTVGGVPTTTP